MKRIENLTQEELKSQFFYDKETGFFARIKSFHHTAKLGVMNLKPNNDGYIAFWVNGKLHSAHRLAHLYMTGDWPQGQVDHIDRVRHHNWWSNLRVCSNQENTRNADKKNTNKSGFKGVSFEIRSGKWRAAVFFNKKQIHLGYFETPEKASIAYENFARVKHGHFYYKNIAGIGEK